MKQAHPVADRLHLVQQVRRQQHRDALRFELSDHAQELHRRFWIQAGRGLVQDGDLRLFQQDLRQAQALAHPAGKRAHLPVGYGGQSHPRQHVDDSRVSLSARQPVQPRGVAQILARREVIIEPDGVGQVPGSPLHLERVARRIVAEHADRAGCWFGQAEQHQDRGRLPGPVRTQQAEDLALGQRQGEPIDSDHRPIVLAEVLSFDHSVHRRPYRFTANVTTPRATAIRRTPANPHSVERPTVMRKSADPEASPPLAVIVTM